MPKLGLTPHLHLPTKFKVLLALVGILFGLVVLGFSLLTMSYKVLGQHYGTRTFYVDRPMLPDHVFYPASMLVDRYDLYRSSPQRRFELHLEYATHRLWASEQLAYLGQNELAVITAVKGQKYLMSSILAIKDLPTTDQLAAKFKLEQALIEQIQTVARLEKTLAGFNTNPLSDLRSQQQILLTQLQVELKTHREQNPN